MNPPNVIQQVFFREKYRQSLACSVYTYRLYGRQYNNYLMLYVTLLQPEAIF